MIMHLDLVKADLRECANYIKLCKIEYQVFTGALLKTSSKYSDITLVNSSLLLAKVI